VKTILAKLVLAAALALALSACDLNKPAPQAERAAAAPAAPPDASLPWAAALKSAQAAEPAASAGASAAQAANLPDFRSLMKVDGPAVVNVITTNKGSAATRRAPSGDEEDDPMLEFFRRFGIPVPGQQPGQPGGARPSGGLGSGFIISADGYILTNAHVVADFDDVLVRMADRKREFKAKVVGFDKRTDVALLKVDAKDLPTVRLGNSAAVEAGEWVAAIGSPFGFANTITAGIVSATGRDLPEESYVPFIQTDVAVNPGNSGGPLINLKGEVIGINSQIYSRTGGYMGVSFAIPIEVALDVAKQLQASGKVTRGRLGVAVQPVTKELAESFKLDSATGVVVANVEAGSAAAKAGLRPGDVILGYNGKQIDNPSDLPRLVAATKPGQKAQLDVWRNGKRERLSAVVGEFPSEQRKASAREPAGKPAAANAQLGLAVSELPPQARKQLGVEYGLVVEDVTGGPAARSPIQPGDVILAVNQDRFHSLEEFNKLIAAQRKGGRVALLVQRGDSALFVPMELG
jgi:serine protease Do